MGLCLGTSPTSAKDAADTQQDQTTRRLAAEEQHVAQESNQNDSQDAQGEASDICEANEIRVNYETTTRGTQRTPGLASSSRTQDRQSATADTQDSEGDHQESGDPCDPSGSGSATSSPAPETWKRLRSAFLR